MALLPSSRAPPALHLRARPLLGLRLPLRPRVPLPPARPLLRRLSLPPGMGRAGPGRRSGSYGTERLGRSSLPLLLAPALLAAVVRGSASPPVSSRSPSSCTPSGASCTGHKRSWPSSGSKRKLDVDPLCRLHVLDVLLLSCQRSFSDPTSPACLASALPCVGPCAGVSLMAVICGLFALACRALCTPRLGTTLLCRCVVLLTFTCCPLGMCVVVLVEHGLASRKAP